MRKRRGDQKKKKEKEKEREKQSWSHRFGFCVFHIERLVGGAGRREILVRRFPADLTLILAMRRYSFPRTCRRKSAMKILHYIRWRTRYYESRKKKWKRILRILYSGIRCFKRNGKKKCQPRMEHGAEVKRITLRSGNIWINWVEGRERGEWDGGDGSDDSMVVDSQHKRY